MTSETRDRFVELIKQKSCVYTLCDKECSGCGNIEMYDSDIESIADHLIANGATFKQVVYFPFPRIDCNNCPKSKGKDMACEELELLYDGKHPKYTPNQDFDLMCEICPWEVTSREYHENTDKRDIGKTKFFTEEQAEQKLKEMRGEEST